MFEIQNKKTFLFILFFGLVFLFATPVLAKYTAGQSDTFLNTVAQGTGVDTSKKDVPTILAKVVEVALFAVGIFFFIMVFYGGYKWMLAKGNEESVTKARDTVIGATIGVIIIVGSYAITNVIVSRLIDEGGEPPLPTQQGSVGTGESKESVACCVEKLEYGTILDAIPTRWYGCMATEEQCTDKNFNCLGDLDFVKTQQEFIFYGTDSNQCLDVANLYTKEKR